MAARTAAQVASDLGRALPSGRTPRASEAPPVTLEEGETYVFLGLNGEEGCTRLLWDILHQYLPIRKEAAERGVMLTQDRADPGKLGIRGLCLIMRKEDLPDGYR